MTRPMYAGTIHRPPPEQRAIMVDLTGECPVIAEDAFEIIYKDYRRVLVFRAAGLLQKLPNFGVSCCAEDLVQDAFLSLWESREDLNPESLRIYYWLYNAVRRRAYTALRNAKNRNTFPASSFRDEEESDEEDWTRIASLLPGPDELAERKELMGLIREGIYSVLTDLEQDAFVACHIHHKTHKTITAELGIKPNRLKGMLHSARKKLRWWLTPRLGKDISVNLR